MAARTYWKGYLKLSLVTIGVSLYSATSRSSRISLHQIHKPTGKRIRYQKVAEGAGPVDTDEIVKGYAVGNGDYVLLEPEELDEIKLETRRTIELVQFVDFCEIDPRYFDKPYYMVPGGDEVAEEGFSVIRDALRKAKKVGLGQMAVRGRDYVVAVKPCGKGMLVETLRYADEIAASESVFADIEDQNPDKEMLSLAGELIERKSKPFNAEAFHSAYSEALRDLIEEKRKSGTISAGEGESSRPSGGKVVDLMAALKESVGKSKPKSKSRSRSSKPSKSKKDEAA